MYDLLNVGNLSAANVLVEGKIYTLEQACMIYSM